MRKSFRVFRRDVSRLFHERRTWVILLGVLITPALYAWFNVAAFWDPYANTANIHIAVANLDKGATSKLTGPVDIGAEITDQLKDNDQLGWEFMDEAEAREAVDSGEVYAAIVIPADFSSDFLSVTTGNFTQPTLKYYVNEKSNAIAPKITDVGASTLDSQITTTFTEQVAAAATEALKDAGNSAELALLRAKTDSLNLLDETSAALEDAREDTAGLRVGIDDSRATLTRAAASLDDVDTLLGDVKSAVTQAQKIIAEAQTEVIAFTDATTSAYVQGITLLADASATANVSASKVTGSLEQASARVDTAIENISEITEVNAQAISELQQILDNSNLDPVVAERLNTLLATFEQSNTSHQQLLTDLQQLNDAISEAADSVQSAADNLDDAMQAARDSATDMRTILTENVPALNAAMSSLSSSAGAFAAALDAQQGQLAQAKSLLSALNTQLSDTSGAVSQLDAAITDIQSGIDEAHTDVVALSSASSFSDLSTLTGLNTEQIAKFIASPVEVSENVVFPIDTYGSAMAALFTNLSLWIGAFVLIVIFKLEVDTEGVEPITVGQAYVGRFLLLAAMAGGQALIVCVGDLMLGMQTVSAVAFVVTGVLIAWAYLSIIYALSVAFGHVGRGLCILLVIMQIPGTSGLYPIELMPDFFRNIYPFLPFTYGIDAMRETIAGFYGGAYWREMGALAIFVILSWVLGLVLRWRLANLNLVFNREIHATDLLVAEDVQVVGGGYRLTDMIRAINNRDETARRGARFTQRYGSLPRVAMITGLVGIVVLSIFAWMFPTHKAMFLFVWLLWCLAIMGFLVGFEYVKQSFEVASEVATLDDHELREAVLLDIPRRRMLGATTPTATIVIEPKPAPFPKPDVAGAHLDALTEEPEAEPEPKPEPGEVDEGERA